MSEFLPAGLPGHVAQQDPEAAAYWEGARAGVLVLPWCAPCQGFFWFPRGFCPRCGSTDLDWRRVSGRGVVHASTVVRRAAGEWAEHVPFAVAVVTLAEGPSVTANVVDCLVADLGPGLQVGAVFERTGPGGLPVLRFVPGCSAPGPDRTGGGSLT